MALLTGPSGKVRPRVASTAGSVPAAFLRESAGQEQRAARQTEGRAGPPGGAGEPGGGCSHPRPHGHHPASGQQGPACPDTSRAQAHSRCPSAVLGHGGGHVSGSRDPGSAPCCRRERSACVIPVDPLLVKVRQCCVGFSPHKGTGKRVTFLCVPQRPGCHGHVCPSGPPAPLSHSVLRCHRSVTCWCQFTCGLSVPTCHFA